MNSLKLVSHPGDEMEAMNTLNLVLSLTNRDRAPPFVFEQRALLFQKDVLRQDQRPEAYQHC
jgi:hypothetical protein